MNVLTTEHTLSHLILKTMLWGTYLYYLCFIDNFKGFPVSSIGKESACNAGDPSLIPGSETSAREEIGYLLQYSWASLMAQLVKNLPAMLETWVWSLGWEDPLEKGKATHSSILARRFHGLYSPWCRKESDLTEQLSLSLSLFLYSTCQQTIVYGPNMCYGLSF